jgi:hypothetical protein
MKPYKGGCTERSELAEGSGATPAGNELGLLGSSLLGAFDRLALLRI